MNELYPNVKLIGNKVTLTLSKSGQCDAHSFIYSFICRSDKVIYI